LMIDSTSNSLGVKSNDLFIETAFMVSIIGFRGFVRAPRLARIITSFAGKRANGAIGDSPIRAALSGLRATRQGYAGVTRRHADAGTS
jgi:hypothetical protein